MSSGNLNLSHNEIILNLVENYFREKSKYRQSIDLDFGSIHGLFALNHYSNSEGFYITIEWNNHIDFTLTSDMILDVELIDSCIGKNLKLITTKGEIVFR